MYKTSLAVQVVLVSERSQCYMSEHCKVLFSIGAYEDQVVCDVIPMDACHILLGKACQFDGVTIYNGKENTYTRVKRIRQFQWLPMEETEEESNQIIFLSAALY